MLWSSHVFITLKGVKSWFFRKKASKKEEKQTKNENHCWLLQLIRILNIFGQFSSTSAWFQFSSRGFFFIKKNRVRKEKTCAENLANRNSRREFRTKLEIFPKSSKIVELFRKWWLEYGFDIWQHCVVLHDGTLWICSGGNTFCFLSILDYFFLGTVFFNSLCLLIVSLENDLRMFFRSLEFWNSGLYDNF